MMMTTARYFGKCRACKKAHVRDFPTIGDNRLPVVVSIHAWTDIFDASERGYLRCECGGSVKGWTALKARFSAKHECNAKCLSSKGPSCECSCGGRNHGASYLAA